MNPPPKTEWSTVSFKSIVALAQFLAVFDKPCDVTEENCGTFSVTFKV